MFGKLLSATTLVAALWATTASAQSFSQVGTPAELPPKGFKGQQYVDSRGCVYLKAGLAGQVNWVLRVNRDRKPMCGFPPTFGSRPVIEVAEETAPVSAPAPAAVAPAPATTAPMTTVAGTPTTGLTSADLSARAVLVGAGAAPAAAPAPLAPAPAAAPAAKPRVSGGYETVAGNGVPQGKVGCYTSAPVAERVRLTNGKTAVVCTRGDGTLTGWRPPIYPDGSAPGVALSDGMFAASSTHSATSAAVAVASGAGTAPAAAATPPKGYKMAWTDDRLNPLRGKGTETGWAQQAQIWTDTVPSEDVATLPKRKRKAAAAAATTTEVARVSTKGSASSAAVASGGAYVVVGSFGVPANAEGAAARLSSMGLPVAKSHLTRKGKTLQVIMAGPFASAADAGSYLGQIRAAGFGDAFVR